MGTIIPIAGFSAIAVITSESASMEESVSLPGSSESQAAAAKFAQFSFLLRYLYRFLA